MSKQLAKLVGPTALVSLLFLSSNAAAGGLCSSHAGGASLRMNSVQSSFARSFAGSNSRSAFRARTLSGKRMQYCVMENGEPKKLRRSSLKAYRGGYVDDLANALVDCDNPQQLALASVKPKHIPGVLLYINEHYRLRLKQMTPDERLARRQAAQPPIVASAIGVNMQ